MRKKQVKIIAIILVGVIAASIFMATAGDSLVHKVIAQNTDSDDLRQASEISNITGVDKEEILRLKNGGSSWNDILEELKRKKGLKSGNDSTARDELLAGQSIKAELLEKLKKEGFTENEINEAKQLLERVEFQLQEILRDEELQKTAGSDSNSITNTASSQKEEEMDTYRKIASGFDLNAALYLVLKLAKQFDGMEKVLDEYLCSLQLDIDLKLYLTDKDEYDRKKQEKSAGFELQKIITAAGIEEKMLEKLSGHSIQSGNSPIVPGEKPETGEKDASSDLSPTVPVPDVQNVKPANPAEEINKELNVIDPMKR